MLLTIHCYTPYSRAFVHTYHALAITPRQLICFDAFRLQLLPFFPMNVCYACAHVTRSIIYTLCVLHIVSLYECNPHYTPYTTIFLLRALNIVTPMLTLALKCKSLRHPTAFKLIIIARQVRFIKRLIINSGTASTNTFQAIGLWQIDVQLQRFQAKPLVRAVISELLLSECIFASMGCNMLDGYFKSSNFDKNLSFMLEFE